MWVEFLKLENIKCFESQNINLSRSGEPYKWVTFLSENGGGKSTALQALALLLAGPESSQQLMPRPLAWLRDEGKPGLISTKVHKDDNDAGEYGVERIRSAFGYSFYVTGGKPISIRGRSYSEPSIQQNPDKILGWLRQNAFASDASGWFASGYGAFRRLTRNSQIIIPSLDPQARYTNFLTQFQEDEGLSAFENWMIHLDYRIAKSDDGKAKRQLEIGIQAINKLLPSGVEFRNVTEEGRICFNVNGSVVSTVSLSDGYRSMLALAGDLIWRMIQTFPKSDSPLLEKGVVLIDELDIHLHPVWQQQIAGWLRTQFPNIQFIVATHSPFIAAGAGEDALTLRFEINNDRSQIVEVKNVAAMNVDLSFRAKRLDCYLPTHQKRRKRLIDTTRWFASLLAKVSRSRRSWLSCPCLCRTQNPLEVFLHPILWKLKWLPFFLKS